MAAHAFLKAFEGALAILVGWACLFMVQPEAHADCSGGGSSSTVDANAGVGTLVVGAEQEVAEAGCAGASTVALSGPRDSDLDAICVQTAISQGRNPFAFCDLNTDQALTVTPGMVAAAFRRIPLPPSVLVVQPAGGRTLVNFATNFYTESGPFTRTVGLLGRRVELRIWPSRFGWVFGDGASLATSSAGSPFPDLDVTHGYRSAGWVGPRVDTTYAAEFRVDGGRWRAVPGSVTIPGAPVDLEVVTARPVLVAAH